MKSDEIKPGRTYEGADGERVVVVRRLRRQWRSRRTSEQVEFFHTPRKSGANPKLPTKQGIIGFAAWAVREVDRG